MDATKMEDGVMKMEGITMINNNIYFLLNFKVN